MSRDRASGILLHISSLPGRFGIGDIGPQACKFADFLAKAGQKYWQILPVNATSEVTGFSPYNCISAFAGNTLLISPELLYQEGLLTKSEIEISAAGNNKKVNFKKAAVLKNKLISLAFKRFCQSKNPADYEPFLKENEYWLADFVTFEAISRHLKNNQWSLWPLKIRDAKKAELENIKNELSSQLEFERFKQYIFFKQYTNLKNYCHSKNIKIIGDIPIYVAHDSTDVWSHPYLFKLSKNTKSKYIAGVPPDYYSKTGQLWGNPVYNWHMHKSTNYRWWFDRFRHNQRLFDLIRIDHFRGLIAYWQVSTRCKEAASGKWIPGPGADFIDAVLQVTRPWSIIAEDLGHITDDVRDIIKKYNFTNMLVLQFGFDNPIRLNPHFPPNHTTNSIVYTGTHDNNTTLGWLKEDITAEQEKNLSDYLGKPLSVKNTARQIMILAMQSPAKIAIIPMQDILGLDSDARMNRPARAKNNWQWRLTIGQITTAVANSLLKITKETNRA